MSEQRPRRSRRSRVRREREPAPPAPPLRREPRRPAFSPGAWLTFLLGIVLGMVLTGLPDNVLNLVQLVLFLAIAVLVALLWRNWARRRIIERRARQAQRDREQR